MTDATAFLAALFTGPLLRADAIVVCAGEDGQARATLALQLFQRQAAPVVVLSGGLHQPPAVLGAAHLANWIVGEGIAPDRVIVEAGSRNTQEQAVNVVALAAEKGWRRLLLVASTYHLPRAFLTFLAALDGQRATVCLLPVAASAPWGQAPPGGDRPRRELWPVETVKIAEYQALGHCASYGEGLAYLHHWEHPA